MVIQRPVEIVAPARRHPARLQIQPEAALALARQHCQVEGATAQVVDQDMSAHFKTLPGVSQRRRDRLFQQLYFSKTGLLRRLLDPLSLQLPKRRWTGDHRPAHRFAKRQIFRIPLELAQHRCRRFNRRYPPSWQGANGVAF